MLIQILITQLLDSLNSCSRFSRSFVRFFWFGLVNKQTCQLTQWFFSLSKNAVSSSIKPQLEALKQWVKTTFVNVSNHFRIPTLSPVFATNAGATGCIPALSAREVGDPAIVVTETAMLLCAAPSVIRVDSCFVTDVTRTARRKSWVRVSVVKPFKRI